MKTKTNNSVAYSVNQDILSNETKVIKYMPKGELVKHVNNIAQAVGNSAGLTGKESKLDLIHIYQELACQLADKQKEETSPAPKSENTARTHRGTAAERLARYSAELTEKSAIANPDTPIRRRIASLKRKIARAQKALAAANPADVTPIMA